MAVWRGAEDRHLRTLTAFSIALLFAGRVSAQLPEPTPMPPQAPKTPAEARIEELERQLRELGARVLELEGDDDKADVVPADGVTAEGQPVSAPARPSEEPSTVSQTGPISGYMDFHLNRPEHEDPQLDFHRFVLLFNHSFSDRLRFIGELELEHGLVEGLEESGELELEQAYLDFRVNPAFNLRAGMLLAPAVVSWCRAAVRGHRHHPDDVV
jgi:hypothetical protein